MEHVFMIMQRAITNLKFMGVSWKRRLWRFFKVSSKSGAFWKAERLSFWVKALRRGEVVAAPAEGVYGYCCDAFNEEALRQLLALKERTPDKGFIVLVHSLRQMERLVDRTRMDRDCYAAMKRYWPGAVTLVLPAKRELPDLLTGNKGTIAIRLPEAEYMREYIQAWGKPLVSTSLNPTGEPPVRDPKEIPYGVVHLEIQKPLKGDVSKLFDPMKGVWLR